MTQAESMGRGSELPEFRAWSESFVPAADASAYIARHVSVTAATLLSEVFFPELVVVRGCVLLSSRYEPANFEQWWDRCSGDTAAIERVLNHFHLWDLFEPSGEAEDRALVAVAHRIARAWHCHAEATFPDRAFEVVVSNEYGPTVVMSSRQG